MEGRQSWQKRSLRKLPTSDIAKYSQQNITIGHMLIFRPTLEKCFATEPVGLHGKKSGIFPLRKRAEN